MAKIDFELDILNKKTGEQYLIPVSRKAEKWMLDTYQDDDVCAIVVSKRKLKSLQAGALKGYTFKQNAEPTKAELMAGY